jgi:anti-anti-sigma factor
LTDEPTPRPGTFAVTTSEEDGTYLLTLRGELDAGGVPDLDRELERAESATPERILIDLDRVEFIDSTGLRTLHEAAKRAERESYRLQMTRGTGFVADMFRLTALDKTLPFD